MGSKLIKDIYAWQDHINLALQADENKHDYLLKPERLEKIGRNSACSAVLYQV